MTFQFSVFVLLLMLSTSVVVNHRLSAVLSEELEKALSSTARSSLKALEQRLSFLAENTRNFARNHFVTNSLIDPAGRELYLPKLVVDFSQPSDIESTTIVDFKGDTIYSTLEAPPDYLKLLELRRTLETGRSSITIPEDHPENIILAEPINYYDTPQGAVIATLNFHAIESRTLTEERGVFYKIYSANRLILSKNFEAGKPYVSLRFKAPEGLVYTRALEIEMEMGVLRSQFLAPIRQAIYQLALVGTLFLAIAVLISIKFSSSLTRPILELRRKVTAAEAQMAEKCSPTGTEDELEDLAQAFDARTEQLMLAKGYTDNILKSMADTLIVVAPDGKIKTVNKATCDLLGYAEQELLEKDVTLIFTEGEGGGLFKGERLEKLIREGAVTDYALTYKTKAGERVPVSFSGSVMRDKDKEMVGIVGISRDMREMNRLIQKEKELAAAAAAAANAERKRASELNQAYEELKEAQVMLIQAEKLNSVGQLAAGVAHEVKNPLMIVLQGTDYLSKHLATGDDNAARVLNNLVEAVKRADSVVRGLMDFAAPTRLQIKSQDLNAVLEEALILVQHELVKSHVTVVKKLGTGLPQVGLDRNKIEQVFVNLFLNAVYAMPDGGTLTVKTYVKEFTRFGNGVGRREADRFRLEETAVITEVEDTGPGIPEDKLSKVFDPFFTTKPTGKGSGLGLSVTQKIIDLHGGMITIRNRIEGGVQVTLMFKPNGRG